LAKGHEKSAELLLPLADISPADINKKSKDLIIAQMKKVLFNIGKRLNNFYG